MSDQRRADWQQTNTALAGVAQQICEALHPLRALHVSATISHAFLLKGTRTLVATNLLTGAKLWEQAQALVRVLLETRISFECFGRMCDDDERNACQRVLDAIALEKAKQYRESGFAGPAVIDGVDVKKVTLAGEQEVVARYAERDLKALRKYGFTGLPLDQRARLVGLEERYNIVYRNFSRNVHSTDLMEHLMLGGDAPQAMADDYFASRDVITLETAFFCVGGMASRINSVFALDHDGQLDAVAESAPAGAKT